MNNQAKKQQKTTSSALNKTIKLLQMNKIEEAETVVNQLLQRVSQSADAYHYAGIIQQKKGNLKNAAQHMEKAISLNPSEKTYYFNLGVTYQLQKRCDKAADCYNQAIEIDPNYLSAISNLGCMQMYLGEFQLAEECFRHAVGKFPNQPNLLNNLGMCLFQSGDIPKAIHYYLKAVNLDNKNPEIQNNIGCAMQKLGQMDSAIASYQNAIALNSSYVKALSNLAYAHEIENNKQQSHLYYQKSIDIKPDCATAHTAIAVNSWLSGDIQNCETHLKRSVQHNSIEYTAKEITYINGYNSFLNALIDFRNTHPHLYDNPNDQDNLFIIGDSHCLSFANTSTSLIGKERTIVSELIVGCKAWHLANNENNEYKINFSNRMKSLPKGSDVIVFFGEIDCRKDEGIIPYSKKSGKDIKIVVESLVQKYIDYVYNIAEKFNHTLYFFTVPSASKKSCCDNVNTAINAFNHQLKSHINSQFILDIYALTFDTEKNLACSYHIDDVHLCPTILSRYEKLHKSI